MKMKDKLLFSVLLLTVMLFTNPAITQAAVNLLLNPSFEEDIDTDNWPDNWEATCSNWTIWGEGYIEFYSDDPDHPARTGQNCVGVYGTDYALWYQDVEAGFEIGKIYYHAFYVKDIYEGGSSNTISPSVEFWSGPRDSGGSIMSTLDFPVNIPNDGQWHLVQRSFVIPEGTVMVALVQYFDWGAGGDYLIDDVWFSDFPFNSGKAGEPNPADGAESVSPDVDELSWTNPEPVEPGDPLTCDVWFTDNYPEYGKHDGDPNFTSYATKIVEDQVVESVTLSALEPVIDLVVEKTYYWRVDPNTIDDSDEYGKVWTFDTINRAPAVDAGYNQSAWIEGAEADVTLTGTVINDGLPLGATSTYEWSKISGSGTMSVVSGDPLTGDVPVDGIISTAVTFDAADTYVVQLEGDDTLLSATYTVKVYVYEEANNGNLVAHWDFENTWDDKVAGRTAEPEGGATYDNGDAAYGDYSLLIDSVGEYVDCGGGSNNPARYVTWASPETSEGSGVYSETMTVTCWVRTDGEGFDRWGGIVTKGDTWSLESYDNYGDNDGDIWFRINNIDDVDDEGLLEDEDTYVASNGAIEAARTIEDDQWHHIAAVNVGNALHLYIDGILARSQGIDESPTGGHDMWIGKGYYSNDTDDDFSFEFAGRIDEVKLFQAPLNAAKVGKDYIDAGGGTSCGSTFEPADINQDCYVNIEDMALFVSMFMECTDISDPDCI
jgi:hypothetical protein